jgi:serine/threonine protein kinase
MSAFPCIKCGAEIDRAFKACPHCGEPVTDFLREYADKPIDGKYRIIQRLGIGGMGEVFKVEHTFLGSIRVVKIIRAQISSSSDAHERFLREARLATKVQHPNVATLHDFSALPDGSHYMVWEFIEGQNLAQILRQQGVLAPKHAVRIAIQALAGLEAIHRAGIVHRDISPENLMITDAGGSSEFVKIIDLGVAKAAESDAGMTQTGMFVGKFRYASPDHLGFLPAGERIDERADLYSLAVVLFEMLTGRPPFEATSPHEYIIHHSRDEYLNSPDLDRITGSTALQTVLARALDRDRNKRFATAHEFSEALALVEPSLADESPKTVSLAFDADATMVTERTRSGQPVPVTGGGTLATPAALPAAATVAPSTTPSTGAQSVTRPAVRPEKPALPDAPATVIDPMPMGGVQTPVYVPPPPAPAAARGAGPRTGTIIAISLLALLLFGAVAVIAFMRFRQSLWPATATTASTSTVTSRASTAKPSQTTVDVTPPTPVLIDTTTATTTGSATATTATTAVAPVTMTSTPVVQPPTTTRAPVKPKPVPVEEPAPVEETAAPEPAPASAPLTYREKGDGNANEAALAALHQQIGGASRVYLTGGDAEMINELYKSIRAAGVSIGEGAPVEIRFTGSVDSKGFGRKSRGANATIKKNGRAIFQYVMPREGYRVGDSPAEAFARILTDALAR